MTSVSAAREHAFQQVARCLSNFGRHKRHGLAERFPSNHRKSFGLQQMKILPGTWSLHPAARRGSRSGVRAIRSGLEDLASCGLPSFEEAEVIGVENDHRCSSFVLVLGRNESRLKATGGAEAVLALVR